MLMSRRSTLAAAALLGAFACAAPGFAAEAKKEHHVAFQVSDGDPAKFNLALNTVVNVAREYAEKGEQIEIELVAFGPGLTMLREDKSPVKDRLKSIKASIPDVTFSACGNTIANAEKAEGKKVEIVSQARVVKAGVLRLTELQEKGWTYIRP